MLARTQTSARTTRSDRAWRHPRRRRFAWIAQDRRFLVLAGWLAVVFLLGGGSRDDIQSLMLLRPASVLVLAYALSGLRREQVGAHRFLLGLAAAWLGLHLLQLVPLPPQLWQALPGRGIVTEIDRAAGLGDVWRPLTMVPYATRNAIWAMLAPLVVLLLGVQLAPEQRDRLLTVLLGLGLFSALLGVLQLLGDPQGQIYFYRITNNGSAVGLFANRNHQGIFLATLPAMLLVWAALRSRAAQARELPAWPYWGAAAGGIVLITPLVLITGSRSGLLTSLLCLLAVPPMLAGWARARGAAAPNATTALNRAPWYGAAGLLLPGLLIAIAGLALLTVTLGRGLALERLIGSDADDLRFRILDTLFAMIRLYAPWGTGFGSFTEVYELHEPHALLAAVYMNHAHNDWLELLLTGGWPGAALAAVAALGFLVRLARLLRPAGEEVDGVLMGRLGLLILLMLALASIGDYPLRVPSLACLAVVAALWAAPGRSPRGIANAQLF